MISIKTVPFVVTTCILTLCIMGRSRDVCLYGDEGKCFIDWDLIKVLSRSLILVPIIKHVVGDFETTISMIAILVCVWEICEENLTGEGDSVINSSGDIMMTLLTASLAFRNRGDVSTGCGIMIEILNMFLFGKSFIKDIIEICFMYLATIFTLCNSPQPYSTVIRCVNYMISKIITHKKSKTDCIV
jgi:hypothetical protein